MPRSFRLALALAGLLAGPAGADRRAFAPPDVPARYPPERAFDLEHLKLDLRFDWDHRAIEGTATNVLHPLRAGLETVTFHASGLDVRRVRLAGAAADLTFRLDPSAETLAIDLDRAYAPADRLEIAIDYAAHPKRGLYFVGPDRGYPGKPKQIWSQGETDFNRGWFPSWDEPDDRATTELLATVPAAWTAIGNGKLLETLDRPDGWRTFHWRMDVPHSTYLTSVVAGELVRVADSWRGIPVEYDVPPGEEARARRSFGKTPDVLEFFSRATGRPYPYAKYAQATAVDFRWGGMENISATTQTIGTLHDEKDENDFPSTGLVAHEAAHQWFGDLITCRDWSEVWLNEGFASYFDALYQEHDRGADQLAIEIDDARDSYFREDGKEYRRPIVTRRFAGPDSMFDATTYDKGALVLHMLRGIAGDEAFFSGIRRYVERFAERTVTTADFEGSFEEATGLSLGAVFDGWVRGAGHPELDVRWEWLDAEKTARLHVEQTQEQTEETHLFAFPLEIAWAGAGGLEAAARLGPRAEARRLRGAGREPGRGVQGDRDPRARRRGPPAQATGAADPRRLLERPRLPRAGRRLPSPRRAARGRGAFRPRTRRRARRGFRPAAAGRGGGPRSPPGARGRRGSPHPARPARGGDREAPPRDRFPARTSRRRNSMSPGNAAAKGTWRPILEGELAERVRETIEQIRAALPGAPAVSPYSEAPGEPATLAGGNAGHAIFYSYLAQAWNREDLAAQAEGFLDQAVEALANEPMGASLYGGFAGVAWAAQPLQGRLYESEEGEDPNEEIDGALSELLAHPWSETYDLIGGLV